LEHLSSLATATTITTTATTKRKKFVERKRQQEFPETVSVMMDRLG
jgi:hypothetical protein